MRSVQTITASGLTSDTGAGGSLWSARTLTVPSYRMPQPEIQSLGVTPSAYGTCVSHSFNCLDYLCLFCISVAGEEKIQAHHVSSLCFTSPLQANRAISAIGFVTAAAGAFSLLGLLRSRTRETQY